MTIPRCTWFFRLAAAALGAVGLAACASLQSAARESFAVQTNCPPERVVVTPRPDVPIPPPMAPPPDVAADPGRLAYWRKLNAVDLSAAANAQVFEFTGCSQHRVSACTWDSVTVGENTVAVAACQPIQVPGATPSAPVPSAAPTP
jgi:hypothetical protein